MKRLLEIACFSAGAALAAAKAGARRIELCDNYQTGGVTPAREIIRKVKNELTVPVHVIIRPREGNFVYTLSEIDEMNRSIEFCREAGVDGIVFGVLDDHNNIDLEKCKEIMELAGPMSTTFHRAIDQCHDIDKTMNGLVDLGINRVLTSGGASTAVKGLNRIKQMQNAFGERITIMPGGGIRSSNVAEIIAGSTCNEYHSAAILPGALEPSPDEIARLLKILETV